MDKKDDTERIVQKGKKKSYLGFLEISAFVGWTAVVYEWNLFGDLIGPISKILDIGPSQTTFFLAIIQFSMVPIIFLVGYSIDILGRKIMWSVILLIASVLTALTGFAVLIGIVPAVAARAGTQGAAQNEQSVAATLVTEEMPARWRGFLYSIVQSGWPVGVSIAGIIAATLYKPFGIKYIWFIAVIPLILIAVSRFWMKESTRFQKVIDAKKKVLGKNAEEFVKKGEENKLPLRQAFDKSTRRDTLRAIGLYAFYLAAQVPIAVLAAFYMEEILHFPVTTAAGIIAIGAFITIPGYWVNGLISEHIGRKSAGIIGTILALAGTIWFATTGHTYILILSAYTFASFWINGNFANIINSINENIPTRVRGTVNVLATGIGQLAWGVVDVIYGLFLVAIGASAVMIIVTSVGFLISLVFIITWRSIKPGTVLEEITT